MKAYLRKAGKRRIPRLRRHIGSFARNLTARAPPIQAPHDMREIDRRIL
jgi:hypothetical protein